LKAETQKFIQSLFSDSSLNRLPEAYGGGRIFDAPVIGCRLQHPGCFGHH
jgi:hypothetical protein